MSTKAHRQPWLCLAVLTLPILMAAPASAGSDRWAPIGPGGGTVNQLISIPGILYALVNGAPFQSKDGGLTWQWSGLGLPSIVAGQLAIDPRHSEHLYLADSLYGVFHSGDGGRTWKNVHAQRLGLVVALIPAATETLALYLATTEAVYRSGDGGVQWTRVFQTEGQITAVAVEPQSAGVVYVAVTGQEDGLFRSFDGGTVWAPILSDGGVTRLAAAPSRPGTLFLAQGSRVRASQDGGATWSAGMQLPNDVTALAVDPFDAETLYAGSLWGLAMSRDGGRATWRILPTDFPWRFYQNRVLALACDAVQPGMLYAGFQWMGVLASPDGGLTWRNSDLRGMSANYVRRLRFAPGSPRTMYIFLESPAGDAVRTLDGGRTWSQFGRSLEIQGPMIDLLHHPLRPNVIYAITGGFAASLFRSPDRGMTWRRIGPAPLGILAFSRGALLVAGDGIWRSADGGRTWSETLPARVSEPGCTGPLCQNRYVFDLITHRGEPTTVHARGYVYDQAGAGFYYEVFQSRDGGRQWRRLQIQRESVAVASASATTVYLAQDHHLLASFDRGRTWSEVGSLDEGTVIRDLIVDPFDPQTLYAATDTQGIQRSRDGGTTWTPLNRGALANRKWLLTRGIFAHPEIPGRLYALPFSRGVFEMQQTDVTEP